MSPADYAGLHERYARILGKQDLSLAKDVDEETRKKLSDAFNGMMRAMFNQKGATLDISILASDDAQNFITTHAGALDSTFQQVEMSDGMRQRLQRSDYIFSGLKAFHEMNEAFPSLLDENGNRKSFEQFLNDVRKIDDQYNKNYLRAEYNFVQQSAEMAAKWEQYSEDADRYNLQYRTAGDDKVRPEHKALDGVTLPMSDPFWEEFYPPNGWNCRCTVVQVRKRKYPETDHDDAMARGEVALQKDPKGMFHFNPGKEKTTVPKYNAYTIKRCNDCDVANGKTNLAFVPDNELCAACRLCSSIEENKSEQACCAKAITKEAKATVQGCILKNDEFGHDVLVSGKSVKEWANQPHRHYFEKNRMLLDIRNIFPKAIYLGTAPIHKVKSNAVCSHLFETSVDGDKAWIIVHEHTDGTFILHSISDSENILLGLTKKIAK